MKDTLAATPDHLIDKFIEKNLRCAYNKELADIISMIRFSAKGGELLTTEPRVNKALKKVKSDRSFTEEQNKWLELIRRDLTENLLMAKETIEPLPIFTRKGASWNKLGKIFGNLESIIQQLKGAAVA